MDDATPFLISHPDGRVLELASDTNGLDAFLDQYKPQGFAVVDPAPTNYAVPDLKPALAERKAAHDKLDALKAKDVDAAKEDEKKP